MAHHVVDRCADRFRKGCLPRAVAVVQRRRCAIQFVDDEVMANLVQLFGRHAGTYMCSDHIQNACRQFSGDSHFGDFLFRVELGDHVPDLLLVNVGKSFGKKQIMV